MDSATKKLSRKKLGELLIEAGIVKPEELPKELEYAQKVSDSDFIAVTRVKELIAEQGLNIPTALRALVLSKQKRCEVDQALTELGWRPRKPPGYEQQRQVKSAFNPEELEAIKHSTETPRKTLWKLKSLSNASADSAGQLAGAPGEAAAQASAVVPSAVPPNTMPAGVPLPPDGQEHLQPDLHDGMPDLPSERSESINLDIVLDQSDTLQLRFSPKAFAQYVKQADDMFTRHEYEEAEKLYLQALGILERTPDYSPREASDLLVKLGRACLQISEFTRAETYLCRALKIREIAAGPDDIGVAECLDYMAELYDIQSQYLEAETFYLHSLGIKERVLPPTNSEVAASLKKLVAVSKRRGLQPEDKLAGQLLAEAGIVDGKAIEEGLEVANERSVPLGRALVSLHYLNEEDLQSVVQAQLLLREGVVPAYIAVRALRLRAQQGISFQDALKEIGLDPDDGSSASAFRLLNAAQALLNAERELTPDHPEVAGMCLKVGDLHMEHGRFRDAEMLYRRAVAICEKTGHPDRFQYAQALTRLGNFEYSTGNYNEADSIYTKLLDLWEAEVGTDDANFIAALESLAAVKYVLNDFKESGRLYQLAVNSKERLLGPEHPGLVPALQGRASCYHANERYAEAEQMYRRARDIHEKIYGMTDQVAVLSNTLGDVFTAQGKFDKAQAEYSHALDALAATDNPDIWLFTSVLYKMARAYSQQNDYARADAYFTHFLRTRTSCHSDKAPDMVEALELYATVLDNLNRHDEATIMRQKAETVRKHNGMQ
jgi:tetratricopeptide (TPR) repeat protein